MTLRKLNFFIIVCAIGLSAYVFLTGARDRMFIACLNGNNDAEDVSACSTLIEKPDGVDTALLARLHLSRAQKYVRLDQHAAALPDLDRAIALDEDNSTNYTQRAIVYSRLGKSEIALLDFATALRLTPNSVWTLQWRANTYRDMQQYREALADYEAVLVLSPEHLPALAGRSLSLAWLGRMEEALYATSDLLVSFPDNPWALHTRATLHANTNKFELAIEDLERYIQIEPGNSEAHEELGHYLGKIGETDEAVKAFDRAIELNSDSISPLKTRIGMWLDMENYEHMLVDAERAYELAPRDDTVLTILFTSYSKTGQDALADQYLDVWVRQSPEFLDTQKRLEYLLGEDHPRASWDTNVMLFKGFIYGSPPLERTDLAMVAIESYFAAGGPDSILFFQRFLDRIGLYRGDFTGVYDDATSKALALCVEVSVMCLGEWSKQSAL